jgi:hypothetical protein
VVQLPGIDTKHEAGCVISPCNTQFVVQVNDCGQRITAVQRYLRSIPKLFSCTSAQA